MIEWSNWHGLYWKSWKGACVDAAFIHPAKYSRALIEHIYRHMVVEKGWLKPGDTVIDPFAGVALGALDAMYYGLHWRGQELEVKFVETGQGCDCEGFTREEWRRYHRRLDQVNYTYGHHWCPGCVRAMGGPAKHHLARRVPVVGAHHYTGNIELWNARYARGMGGWGTAALVQGDSRYPVLHQWGSGPAEGAVSSPPYADISSEQRGGGLNESYDPVGGGVIPPRAYGDTPGQLGQMPLGDLAGSVSSPPYRGGGEHYDQLGGWNTNTKAQGRLGREQAGYGDTPGQLAKMPSGAVSSPPWGRGAEGGLREAKFKDPEGFARAMSERDMGDRHGTTPESRAAQMERDAQRTYGDTPGNLGQMDACVSSPPFGAGETRNRQPYQDGAVGDMMSRAYTQDRQGTMPGNLAHERGETFWSAARMVVQGTYDLLAPGGHSAWVVKDFVRKGQIVPFTEQWRELCESCGFVTLHGHRAHLVQDRGTQRGFWRDVDKGRARKSFFRRLAERNGSPPINWEVVWCMEKKR